MTRKLLAFSGIALVIAIGCVAGAGYLVRHDYGTWSVSNTGPFSQFRHVRDQAPPSLVTSKSLTWNGGNRLEVNLPGRVDFTQGPQASVQVSGPADLVERVRLENGRLWMTDGPGHSHVVSFTIDRDGFHGRESEDDVRVTIVAPGVTSFEQSGSGDLRLRNIDLPELELRLTGSSHITADGHAKALTLDVSGSGHADLADLIAGSADIDISGSGSADINARDKADVDISGSGDVDFSGRPAVVNTSITGSGSVE